MCVCLLRISYPLSRRYYRITICILHLYESLETVDATGHTERAHTHASYTTNNNITLYRGTIDFYTHCTYSTVHHIIIYLHRCTLVPSERLLIVVHGGDNIMQQRTDPPFRKRGTFPGGADNTPNIIVKCVLGIS